MISCTEFIPAYSEGFKFLESIGGRVQVENFWAELSRLYLNSSLEKLVAEEGLKGCYRYWSHSLNEEAADFTMSLDEEKNEFSIRMHQCPSKKMLLDMAYMTPYASYCDHCAALYRPVIEKYGFTYHEEVDAEQASCQIVIKKKE